MSENSTNNEKYRCKSKGIKRCQNFKLEMYLFLIHFKEVNEHIQNGCKSELKSTTNAHVNECSFNGCKTREVIPIVCNGCKMKFCIRHRFDLDHDCSMRLQMTQDKKKKQKIQVIIHVLSFK